MSAVRRSSAAVTVLLGLLTSSCGVPGDGPVERVEDDEVPYRLLEPTDPTGPSSDDPAPGPAPSAFWLREDRLVPGMAVGSCDDEPDDVVEQVLDVLADGPQDDERVGGRSTAIQPESSLTLVGLDDGTAGLSSVLRRPSARTGCRSQSDRSRSPSGPPPGRVGAARRRR